MPDEPQSRSTVSASASQAETSLRLQPKFDADGLIPAIVADAASGDILMFAWMNEEALTRTIETRKGHFWSRSRGRIWLKGEESGNRLNVIEMRVDCDQDVVLMQVNVEGHGLACHTGERSCFYRRIDLGGRMQGGPVLTRIAGVSLTK